jgi:hypothetical protein
VLQARFAPVQVVPLQQGCPAAAPHVVQICVEMLHAMLAPVQLLPAQHGKPEAPHALQIWVVVLQMFPMVQLLVGQQRAFVVPHE